MHTVSPEAIGVVVGCVNAAAVSYAPEPENAPAPVRRSQPGRRPLLEAGEDRIALKILTRANQNSRNVSRNVLFVYSVRVSPRRCSAGTSPSQISVMYWLLLGLAAMVYLVGWFIGRSRLGFALRIIGNDEVVAVHCGINTARAKVILFVVSCTFASITGALVAPRWSYVEPSIAFSPFLSFEVVIMALLGGVHRLWGPLVGVIPFTLLWEFISAKFPTQTTILLGACFLLIVYFIPRGVVGLLEDLMRGHVGGLGSVKGLFQRGKTDNA